MIDPNLQNAQGPPNMNMKYDVSTATDVVCEKCEGNVYNMAYFVKRFSAIVSPTGQEALVPVQILQCTGCLHVNKEFVPEYIANKE